jgi:peptidoglycan/xylan/chitin deacetylase (PgdA/CDA1 family)
MLGLNDLPRINASEDWRKGAAAVVALTFDVDAESPILAAGAEYERDVSTMSHQAYGPRVGLPRILALLADYNLPATFFVPGMTAERWPAAISSIAEAGHAVALHSYSHHCLVPMSEAELRQDLDKSLTALAALGIEPVGFRAPLWQTPMRMLELLVEFGVSYDSSLMDDDRPYVLGFDNGSLVELPVHWLLDDWEQYAFLPDPSIGYQLEAPDKVVSLWTSELDAMRATESLCVLVCHPFISGRPSRIEGIRRFIEFALDRGDVRFSSCEDLVPDIKGVSR